MAGQGTTQRWRCIDVCRLPKLGTLQARRVKWAAVHPTLPYGIALLLLDQPSTMRPLLQLPPGEGGRGGESCTGTWRQGTCLLASVLKGPSSILC